MEPKSLGIEKLSCNSAIFVPFAVTVLRTVSLKKHYCIKKSTSSGNHFRNTEVFSFPSSPDVSREKLIKIMKSLQ